MILLLFFFKMKTKFALVSLREVNGVTSTKKKTSFPREFAPTFLVLYDFNLCFDIKYLDSILKDFL